MSTVDAVRRVLLNNPAARENDTLLLLAVYQQLGLPLPRMGSSCLRALPKPATVLKARARLQNEHGFCPPSPGVQEARRSKARSRRGAPPQEENDEL